MPFFRQIGLWGSGGGAGAPTVNIAEPVELIAGVQYSWEVTYNGPVTAFNFVVGEITQNGSPPFMGFSIVGGDTGTAVVTGIRLSGSGTVGITVQAGACQNNGLDNIESDPSTTVTIT